MSETGRGGADVDGVPGCSRVHQGPSAPSPRPEQGVGRSQRTPGGYLQVHRSQLQRQVLWCAQRIHHTLSHCLSSPLSHTPEEGDS